MCDQVTRNHADCRQLSKSLRKHIRHHERQNANMKKVLNIVLALALFVGISSVGAERFVYAMDIDIANLDTIHSIDTGSAAVNWQIYEPLVRLDINGDIVPLLAESWITSDDSLEWTFALREGVVFHDGTPFNADAVKYHFDRMLDPEKPNRTQGSFYMITDVVVDSEYEIRFVLDRPFAPFLALLTSISGGIASPTAVELHGDDYPFNPVGTGPWRFKEWIPGDRTILEANTDHWRNVPGYGTLEYRPVLEPGARVIMLETGAAHAAASISPSDIDRIEARGDIDVYIEPISRGWLISFNVKHKPFDDVRVRQALNYAIDVSVITDDILLGTARPFTSAVNSAVYGYAKQDYQYDYNPEKARELLAEAGYPNGFDATIWYPGSGAGMEQDIPEVLQAMLADVGINLKLESMALATFVDAISKNPEDSAANGKELILLGMSAGTGEAANILFEFLHTDSWAPVNVNRGFYSNPVVDELIMDAMTTLEADAQLEIMAELQSVVWEDAPWVFLYEMSGVYGASKDVAGLNFLPQNYILFDEVHPANE